MDTIYTSVHKGNFPLCFLFYVLFPSCFQSLAFMNLGNIYVP